MDEMETPGKVERWIYNFTNVVVKHEKSDASSAKTLLPGTVFDLFHWFSSDVTQDKKHRQPPTITSR